MGIFDKLKKLMGGGQTGTPVQRTTVDRSAMRYDAHPEVKPNFVYKTDNIVFRQVDAKVKTRFDGIMKSLGEFDIQMEVPVNAIFESAEKWYRPYSYTLYRGGSLAGIVMLINDGSRRTPAYIGSKEAGEKAGIPTLTFYGGLPNEADYVVNRIRNSLTKL